MGSHGLTPISGPKRTGNLRRCSQQGWGRGMQSWARSSVVRFGGAIGLALAAGVHAQPAAAVFGAPVEQVTGEYRGAMSCSGAPAVFSLVLEATGTIPGSIVGHLTPGVEGPPAPMTLGLQRVVLRGDYDAARGTLVLRAAGVSPLRGLLGVVHAGGGTWLLQTQGANAEACTLAVAVRGRQLPRDWAALVAEAPAAGARPAGKSNWAMFRLPGKLERLLSDDSCSPGMLAWMGDWAHPPADRQAVPTPAGMAPSAPLGAVARARLMFSDASFEPHFGKAFRSHSAAEVDNLQRRLQRCLSQPEARALLSRAPGSLLTAFIESPSFSHFEKNASALALGELRAWLKDSRARVLRGADGGMDPGLPPALVAAAAPLLTHLWPAERAALDVDVLATRKPMALALLRRELTAALSTEPRAVADWESVAAIAGQARVRYPFLDTADVQPLAEQTGAEAARRLPALLDAALATSSAELATVEALGRWPEQHPLLWAVLPPPTQQALRIRLGQRQSQLLAEVLAGQRRTLAAQLAATSGLAAVQAAVALDAELNSNLARFTAQPEVQAFARERAVARTALLATHLPAVRQAIEQTGQPAQVDALQRAVLAAGDEQSASGRQVLEALVARRTVVAAALAQEENRQREQALARQAEAAEQARLAEQRRTAEVVARVAAVVAQDGGGGRGDASDCAALATHPDEPGLPVGRAGVPYDRLNGPQAVTTCARALAIRPAEPRTMFHYCRALGKVGRAADALAACEKSASDGYAFAAYGLALLLWEDATLGNRRQAMRWARVAAEQGVGLAAGWLGDHYHTGQAPDGKDYRAAFEWYRRGAQAGELLSMYNLAVYYDRGRAVPRDTAAASRSIDQLVAALDRGVAAPAELAREARSYKAEFDRRRSQRTMNDRAIEDSERRLNDVLRDQFNDASRNGWR